VMASHTGGIGDTVMEEDTPSRHADSSVHVPNVLDATMGMQELEDAMAENQWCTSETYATGQDTGMFLHAVDIGGVTMRKFHAITQQFRYATTASSTDQLRHVAQES